MRRARHRLRAAAQRVVRVESAVRDDRSFEVLDEATGELVTVGAGAGVRRKRMGQKVCGRATSMALPGKGETIGSGRAERAQSVELIQRPDGRVSLRNIYRCGSVWCCPVCSYGIAAERGKEVQRVFEYLRERGAGAYLLTLTARHWAGMDLKALRKAVSETWQKIQRSRAWRSLSADLGVVGMLRSLEVTHGPNGWHPHLHILIWARGELSARGAARARRTVRSLWCREIERATGARPSRAHGLHAQKVHARADYLTKLGIAAELTSAVTKEGRGDGHRSVWQILRDLADQGRPEDVALWRAWSEGIHGARQLTWAGKELKAIRAELGIEDETDEALAEREAEGGAMVAEIPTPMFARLEKALPGFALWLCESAESYGPRGVVEAVRALDVEMTLSGTSDPPPWWRGFGGGGGAPATLFQRGKNAVSSAQ